MIKALPVSFCLFFLLLTGCTQVASTSLPIIPTPLVQQVDGVEANRQSDGGGEPRTAGYWLTWNSCAPGNQSDVAASNGGREAGWVILDDLLFDPGLTLGDLKIETCEQAIKLLKGLDLEEQDRSADAAYLLARELVVAQLNLLVGAESCPAIEEFVIASQMFLSSLGFNGQADYLTALSADDESPVVNLLLERLNSYNLGELCR